MAGRFAPSPTGPLHPGSLATALASYLDAKAHGLDWWVRIEDLDPPREVPGAAPLILRQLNDHGLVWDFWPKEKGARANGVLYQSDRAQGGGSRGGDASLPCAYSRALNRLIDKGMAFRCRCSRSQLALIAAAHEAVAVPAEDAEPLYPGLCRPPAPAVAPTERHAWRFFDPQEPWVDTAPLQALDNFVVKRADGLWAYHLAVVVDDAYQGVTRIVRGSDLTSALPRHQSLQRALGFDPLPTLHVPVVVNTQGQKLSKQTLAPALGGSSTQIRGQKTAAWAHLEQHMPTHWLEKVRPCAALFLD